MMALSSSGCIVFRNETGRFWTGRVLHKADDQVTLGNSVMIPCGLAVGSADIIGICPDGRFLAVEVKTKTGRPTKEQLNFIEQVKKQNGIAGIARSVQDALDLIPRQ